MNYKQSRWYRYEIIDGVKYLCVYDKPYANLACAMSIIKPEDISYYRQTFNLSKLWGDVEEDSNMYI